MDFTNDDIASLGDKLAALDLTDGEREALRTMVAMATDDNGDEEVTGFASGRIPVKTYLGGALGDEIATAQFASLGVKLGPPRRSIIKMGDGETI